jgi:1-pyrroline-5-carboxylate dehydrogenase
MSIGHFVVPPPVNEPVRAYEPGSAERASLKDELARQYGTQVEVAPIIGGKDVRTGKLAKIVCPHEHGHVLGQFHRAAGEEVSQAIAAARAAKPAWAALPWQERVAVFLRAAALLRGKHRAAVNAATMLGQSKTAHQAEIDSACELIDFWSFNAAFYEELLGEQPLSPTGFWNRVEARALDGFVFAVSPFNFTSIAGNLPAAPALCGNTVLWKPASTSVLSGHYIMKIFEEAGLPPGVINFVPGSGSEVGDPVLASPELGGIHFTGSTDVFQGLWRTIGDNIARYRQYPRIVGETGGKNFVVVHESADMEAVVAGLVRGAYEYQGQKCSAASRAYVPRAMWRKLRDRLVAELAEVKMGDIRDFRNFMGAVIDRGSYTKLEGAIDAARQAKAVSEVIGGECDDGRGWFVRPTILVTDDPRYTTMEVELFGPVLTVFPYDDGKWEETLRLCDQTSPYGLTGAIFATDRAVIDGAVDALRYAAGNFYVNDKPTGAVVGQQPFGGARASGTNDKAGSKLNLTRWISARAMKETFAPPTNWRYGFMAAE